MDKAEKALRLDSYVLEAGPAAGCHNIEMSDSATLLRAELAGDVGLHDLQCLNHLLLLSGPVPSAPSRTTHFPLIY